MEDEMKQILVFGMIGVVTFTTAFGFAESSPNDAADKVTACIVKKDWGCYYDFLAKAERAALEKTLRAHLKTQKALIAPSKGTEPSADYKTLVELEKLAGKELVAAYFKAIDDDRGNAPLLDLAASTIKIEKVVAGGKDTAALTVIITPVVGSPAAAAGPVVAEALLLLEDGAWRVASKPPAKK
jgi:hypothetical protein